MYVSLAIKSGYFQALSPAIGIPVYDAFSVPAGATYPYVIISEIRPDEIVTAKCKSYDVRVTLDIVTGFSSPAGMNRAFEISEDIENIINPPSRQYIDLTSMGYQIGQTRVSDVPNQFRTDNYWIYRNIKTYTHKVFVV